MGRAGAGVILLVLSLAVLAAPAEAQTLHEDYSRAGADYRLLRLFAGLTLAQATDGLNASLERRHDAAAALLIEASARSALMTDAVSRNASAATSAEPLAPLAAGATNLTGATSRLVDDWRALDELNETGLRSREDAARARLLIGAVGDDVEAGMRAADAYDALGYDTSWLRAALDRFVADVNLRIVPPAPEDSEPFLALEIVPPRSVVTGTFEWRGVLVAPDPEGALVRLDSDGEQVRTVTANAAGYFSTRFTSEAADIGGHVARASARNLTSAEVPYEILRYPTRIALQVATPEPGRASFLARLQDVDGRPLANRTILLEPGAGEGPASIPLTTDEFGRAALQRENVTASRWIARASFAGDAFYAPSEAITEGTEPPAPPPPPEPAPTSRFMQRLADAPFPLRLLLVAIALATHPAGLEALGRRRARGAFTTLFLAGPPLILLLLLVVLEASAPVAVAVLVATVAGGFFIAGRHRGVLLDLALLFARLPPTAPMPVGTAPSEPARAAAPDAPAAPAAAAPASLAAPRRLTPLEEMLAAWDAMLARLQRRGVDTGPMTVREVAGALRAAADPATLRPLVRALERVLYGGATPRADEVDLARAFAATMEAGE